MRLAALLLTVLAGATTAAPSEALTFDTTHTGPTPPRVLRWTRTMHVPPPAATIVLYAGQPCPGLLPAERSCTYPTDRPDRFVIYLAHDRSNGPRWVYYHEIGHAFGMARGDPSEPFADTYAFCAYGMGVAGCDAIRRAGGWTMTPAGR